MALKIAWEAVNRVPAKMVKDATWIRGFISGRWKMVVAGKQK